MFSGVYTALITPFKNDKVDFDAFGALIESQYKAGVNGIVPCGTTGESPTLSYEEHEAVIEFAVRAAKGKMKVLAGTGSNSTDEAIHFTKFAKKAGCDGALVVSPYYNKPTQKGLYLHFKTIADAVDIPIVVYNIAGRTGVNVEPATLAKLTKDCKNIIGVKESSGSLDQMSAIKSLSPNIDLISGDDALTLPLLSVGGCGVISVLTNIAPAEVVALVKAFNAGNIKEAAKIHYKLLPITKAMFIETNPIPVKTAAALLGICQLELRLPMCEMEETNKAKLEKALRDFGLLK
ncbi:4-hydroxy-tetrahydrodipicolinate synthase [Endomicrobium proavitum]|uniref:4-hydroxy-tetrahydrodipicolinate synthase n=1 Tax=Endomicrobium proavitum TaxID=1408281 RepID=A0A0G3WJT2_9BACT|nr:4-hydroxy-tetrahydrodipicolinate synthase [Endomicrobium proavitum]AKL98140.1 4-hydroxy-tetrahydrodipicolinate synthase [Endomicrobium proavitum]